MRHVFSILSAALAVCLGGCARSTADLPAVENFDLRSYAGRWYEIARLPHSFERGMQHVTADYTLNSDGTVTVENRGVKDGVEKNVRGKARFKKGHAGRGELEVTFFGPFYGAYRILHLEPDGSAALVTSGTRDYFWILARSPAIPAETLDRFRKQAADWGFAVEKLEYPQP